MNKPSLRAAISMSVFALLSVAVIAAETGTRSPAEPRISVTSQYRHAPLIVHWVSVVRRIRDAGDVSSRAPDREGGWR